MYRFFRRIFLSVWIIIIASAAITGLVAQLLPEHRGDDTEPLYVQLAQNVALEIRRKLLNGELIDAESVARDNILEADRILRVYVIAPDGHDILGRDYENYIDLSREHAEKGVAVIREGLEGYTVVCVRYHFPIAKLLITPWARLVLALTALAVSIMVALMLSHSIVKPVRLIRQAGQRVALGDLSVRVFNRVKGRRDDIELLAKDFDFMTQQIDNLLKKQKRLMRDVSHELRSPLARLEATFSLARQQIDQQNGKLSEEYIDRMEAESERLNSLIGQILIFTRLESGKEVNRHTTDLVDLLNMVAEDASIEGYSENKDVIVKGLSKCVLNLDSALIQSAFENIIRNAIRYTKSGSNVMVNVSSVADEIYVEVRDSGPGVPEQDLVSLFEPFCRVDASRDHKVGGGGIGLAIVERAVKLHDGTVKAENLKEGGLKVTVTLPKLAL